MDKLLSSIMAGLPTMTDVFRVLSMPETTSEIMPMHQCIYIRFEFSELYKPIGKAKSPSEKLNTMLEVGLQFTFPQVNVAVGTASYSDKFKHSWQGLKMNWEQGWAHNTWTLSTLATQSELTDLRSETWTLMAWFSWRKARKQTKSH